jgi:GT2 family glycosyltransferase
MSFKIVIANRTAKVLETLAKTLSYPFHFLFPKKRFTIPLQSVTLIISVYKNVPALALILKALENQTCEVDQIIISEDGNFSEMKNFVTSLQNTNILHLTQEDIGWRKNKALNRAITAATSEYLIFIDGDVIPHKRFIEGHLKYAEKDTVCVGKRSELGQKYSHLVYEKKISVNTIAKNYLLWVLPLHLDRISHYEDGIYSKFLNKITASRKIRHIIGCNFSCYRENILAINGFNENFIHPAIGEDVDITWRFNGIGIRMKSCRYVANVYHLWHKKNFNDEDMAVNSTIMQEDIEKNQFICLNGIKKLDN